MGSEWEGVEADDLEGGAVGGTALRCGEVLVVVGGDGVVNPPGRGLELFPGKYCRDQNRLKENVRGLVGRPLERLLMAHGESILAGASERVAALL